MGDFRTNNLTVGITAFPLKKKKKKNINIDALGYKMTVLMSQYWKSSLFVINPEA